MEALAEKERKEKAATESPAAVEAARREADRLKLVQMRREANTHERKPISALDAKNQLLRQQKERGERSAPKKDATVVSNRAPKGEVNAIKDSIARKGGNSYYFAHNEQRNAEKTKVLLEPKRIDVADADADALVVEDVTGDATAKDDDDEADDSPPNLPPGVFQESIQKHHENSYYYAHGATTSSHKIDNAPVRLETSARKEIPITEVREFGFSEENGGEKICVYIPAPGIGAATDDDLTLLWDDTTVVLRYWHDGHKRQLDLPGRKGPFIRTRGRMDCKVKKCKVKKKPDKLVLFVYLDLDPGSDSDVDDDDAGI